MNRKKVSPKKPTKKINRQSEPLPLRYILLTLSCGLILVVGFFFAARQHFSSIDYGIKNSKLKKQIEELETDKRQLILAKEIALTPSEIKKSAQKIGLMMMTASNIEVFRPNGESAEKPKDEKINDSAKTKQISSVKAVAAKPEVKKVEKAEKAEKAEKKKPEVKVEKEKSSVKKEKK